MKEQITQRQSQITPRNRAERRAIEQRERDDARLAARDRILAKCRAIVAKWRVEPEPEAAARLARVKKMRLLLVASLMRGADDAKFGELRAELRGDWPAATEIDLGHHVAFYAEG